jgi:hypothetical protein
LKKRYNETLEHYNTFLKKHPASKKLKEAQQIEKETLDELKKLKI